MQTVLVEETFRKEVEVFFIPFSGRLLVSRAPLEAETRFRGLVLIAHRVVPNVLNRA